MDINGFTKSIVDKAKADFRPVAGILPGGSSTLEDEFKNQIDSNASELWSVDGKDWYQVYGYRFKIVVEKGPEFHYVLPIPPQTFIVKPVMANRVTPTIGGVVEEVSPITFWMITLAGTTGIAIGRSAGDEKAKEGLAGKFRSSISTTGLLAGVFAQVNSAISKIGGTADQIKNAFNSESLGSIASGLTGAVNDAIAPSLPFSASAVDPTTNGFTESQELSKFFYMYQRLKAKSPESYELFFVCDKTNQEWRIAVKDFSLQQNAQNPHLYRYQISLQGWDIKNTKSEDRVRIDRFGPDGDLKSVNTMGKENLNATIGAIGKLSKIFNKKNY